VLLPFLKTGAVGYHCQLRFKVYLRKLHQISLHPLILKPGTPSRTYLDGWSRFLDLRTSPSARRNKLSSPEKEHKKKFFFFSSLEKLITFNEIWYKYKFPAVSKDNMTSARSCGAGATVVPAAVRS